MRSHLLISALLLTPCTAHADPQCISPPTTPQPSMVINPGSIAAAGAGPAQPVVQAVKPESPPAPVSAKGNTGYPVLDHVAASGARLTEAGVSHGMRIVIARAGDQFVRLYAAPDGQAVVAGLHRLGYGSSVLLRFPLYGARFSLR